MEKRDLLKDEIEKISRVLGKMLANILGFKSLGDIEQGIKENKEQLKSNLDIDIDELITLSIRELKEYLVKRKMTIGHFEMKNDKDKAKVYLTKSLELIHLENEISQTMSFERLSLKSEVENMLQQSII